MGLVNLPWSQDQGPSWAVARDPSMVGLSVGVTALAVFLLAKVAEVVVALLAGFTSLLTLRHLLGVPGVVLQDILAAVALGVVSGLVVWPMPWRRLRLALAYLVLIGVAALAILGVGLYRLYQTPLTWGQIGLLGTLTDLGTSFRANLTVPNVVFACAVVALVVALPWRLGVWAAARLEAMAVPGRRWRFAAWVAIPALGYLVLPGFSLIGLELNPLAELVTSATRFAVATRAQLDLGANPRFSTDRVFDPEDPEPEDTSALFHPQDRPDGPMNLLLLVGESWAASQHCFLDGPEEACPRLMAERGHTLTFDHYYTVTPVSMKSLFSLTCSIYPIPRPQAVTYVHGNIACRSISEVLKERGYATSLFHGGHFHYSDKLRYFKHRKYDVMRDADLLEHRKRYPLNGWGADDRAVRDDFLGWLQSLPEGKPWHTLLIPITPHYPYQPIRGVPSPFGNATLRDRYLNQMRLQDTIIGDILDALRERGELERTLVVLVGDHGEAFGEHPGNEMHGSYIYEESVRVPLIMLNPRLFSGQTSHRIGNHVDLVPTIADVMGLAREPRWEGISLLTGYRPHRIHFYTHYAHYQLGLRDGRYKFIHDKDRDGFELYDLLQDPGETRNLATLHPDMVTRYSSLCDRWESFYQELIPHYEAYRLPKGPCTGKDVCFLDELTPTFVHGKARRRRSALGRPLRLAGKTHGRGWGVEAPSILRFSVAGLGYSRLVGEVGHDDDIYAGQLGETVSGQIYVDDELVLATGKMKKGTPPLKFDIPIEGAGTIELFGHDMDGIAYRDDIDWVDVRLVR